jgi:agmatinase
MKQKQFGGLSDQFSSIEKSRFVILPVPFEGSHTLFKGSEKGPEAIIEASAALDLYDIHTDCDVSEAGIHTSEAIRERSADKMIRQVYARTTQLLKKKKFPVILGGETTVAIGAFRAFADYFKDKDLSIVHFDAHGARRTEVKGNNTAHHHCVVTHAEAFAPVVQAGVRSMSYQELETAEPGRIFYASVLLDPGNKAWMYDFLNKLSRNVFISVDLDVFDPSLFPAVASPEPGGLFWSEMNTLLTAIGEKSKLTGACVAGLTPIKYNKAPNFVAARLIHKLITLKHINSHI